MGTPVKHYRRRGTGNRRSAYDHRLRAARALGKPLPPGAVVHHADGTKDEHAPLVICQDETYHRLLHARMRIVRAGGNPNTEKICSACQQVKPRAAFKQVATLVFGLSAYCKACLSDKFRQWPSSQTEYRRPARRAEYLARKAQVSAP